MPFKPGVAGSSPVVVFEENHVAQLVEHRNLAWPKIKRRLWWRLFLFIFIKFIAKLYDSEIFQILLK